MREFFYWETHKDQNKYNFLRQGMLREQIKKSQKIGKTFLTQIIAHEIAFQAPSQTTVSRKNLKVQSSSIANRTENL